MAIYTTMNKVPVTEHCVFESSNLKSTIVGNIYDGICEEDIDNGMPLKLGKYTGEGLQLREVTKAGVKDQVVIAGTVPVIKDAMTTLQANFNNFYNKAGNPIRCYEVVKDDIFAISKNFITGEVAVGKYVCVEADGTYKIYDTDKSATNGFVGLVHSIATGTFYDMVRILVVQNTTIA